AVVLFIPFFRRAGLTSAFEYLGDRYGPAPRLYGTISFIVMQLIRMAQILFLIAIPIQLLTGAPIIWVIIGTSLFIAFYTVVGGIEAVVWADVVQAVVLLVGGVLWFGYMVFDMPGGLGEVWSIGRAHDKFSLGSFDWDLTRRTFWTVAILGVVNWVTIY